jgi:hypothetical protein
MKFVKENGLSKKKVGSPKKVVFFPCFFMYSTSFYFFPKILRLNYSRGFTMPKVTGIIKRYLLLTNMNKPWTKQLRLQMKFVKENWLSKKKVGSPKR